MKLAITGYDYCGQYSRVPPPHELLWLPFKPTLAEMFAAVGQTPDWADVFVTVLAESVPLPSDFETCPCPTFGICEDWELYSDALFANAPAYDFLLMDGSGVAALKPLLGDKLITFCPVHNFSHVFPEMVKPLSERSIDILFVGNTEPRERFVNRAEQLVEFKKSGLMSEYRVVVTSNVSREEYQRLLGDSKIVFNPPASRLQDGVNARNFEAGAHGCAVLGRRGNRGLSAFFAENELLWHEDGVLKSGEDMVYLVSKVRWALSNLPETQAIADNLRRKVLQPLMPTLLETVSGLLEKGTRRRKARTTIQRIVGLMTAFGNWGGDSHRDPEAVDMCIGIQENVGAFLPPALVVAVIADILDEYQSAGGEKVVDSTGYGYEEIRPPELLWQRAMDSEPNNPFPVYQLARYLLNFDEARGRAGLRRALEMLDDGAVCERLPELLFPVRTPSMDDDRILAAQLNSLRVYNVVLNDGSANTLIPLNASEYLRKRILRLLDEGQG